jgi:DNA-binding transcriptional regulator YiaG
MNNQAFEALLQVAGLSKKEFARLVDMNSNSVTNWNKSDKVPQWVGSWLNLYIENRKCKELKALLKETVCDHEA